jgi:hypothetical protein
METRGANGCNVHHSPSFQLTDGGPRPQIPPRNCVEIVMKLQELGLLQVIYTCNAKEFLTPEQLKREIQDEVRG